MRHSEACGSVQARAAVSSDKHRLAQACWWQASGRGRRLGLLPPVLCMVCAMVSHHHVC